MIELQSVDIRVGTFALDQIAFTIPTGQYGILMGKTGCGKTTILEAVCGLKKIAHGKISLMGRDVTSLKPAQRGIGFVPQDGALFSTMTVYEQLAFALTIRKWKKKAIDERVHALAEELGITHLLKRKPVGLSGGERQRVALGRALSSKPAVLCLDEPLSALDEITREEMYELLRSLKEHINVTVLHITHSLQETRKLADKILILKDGQIEESNSLLTNHPLSPTIQEAS